MNKLVSNEWTLWIEPSGNVYVKLVNDDKYYYKLKQGYEFEQVDIDDVTMANGSLCVIGERFAEALLEVMDNEDAERPNLS